MFRFFRERKIKMVEKREDWVCPEGIPNISCGIPSLNKNLRPFFNDSSNVFKSSDGLGSCIIPLIIKFRIALINIPTI